MENKIFNRFNVRIKEYPTFRKITWFKNYQCRLMLFNNVSPGIYIIDEEKKKEYKRQALTRAKNTVKDYIYSNNFTHFFTLTFNEKYCHGNDMVNFKYTLNWFKNINRNKKFNYIFVFEQHKKGGLHIHGVLEFNDKLKIDKNEHGYDKWADWIAGFSNISRIDDIDKVATYVCKYIIKSPCQVNKHYYFCSRGLKKPIITEELYRGLKYIYKVANYEDDYKKIFLDNK